jgi:hypothetical protein
VQPKSYYKEMNNMPLKLRKELSEDSEYKKCFRAGSECAGRITWEHALTYAGRQIQKRFAIIPLCVFHHLGEGLDKRWNVDCAMSRATEEDKKEFPILPWKRYS